MDDMTDPDHIVELADRIAERMSRGEAWEAEFEVEFHGLTTDEQDALLVLLRQRDAHGEEKLEALGENVRILKLLVRYQQGNLSALDFVARVRGVLT
jgi:hypothetical protein